MFIIGITGGTGSGKTTIVNKVKNLFDQSDVGFLSSEFSSNSADAIEAPWIPSLPVLDPT